MLRSERRAIFFIYNSGHPAWNFYSSSGGFLHRRNSIVALFNIGNFSYSSLRIKSSYFLLAHFLHMVLVVIEVYL
jgi:hypothetical protein